MLSGEEKGALLLKSLAPEVMEKILIRLGPARRARLRAVMERVQAGPQTRNTLTDLLNEVRQNAVRPAERYTEPASAAAQRVASQAASPAASGPAVSAPSPGGENPGLAPLPQVPEGQDAFKTLASLSADRIALVLETETPRTASILLNYLEATKAGEVFRRLSLALRAEVSVQFSTQGMPGLDVLRRIVQAVVQKCRKIEEKPVFAEGTARLRKMADMVRLLDRAQRQQVLSALEEKAPEAATQIKEMLYRFEDAQRLDNRSMQKVLKEIDTKNLALALRDTTDAIKERFLSNLSKRAQENLTEEMELARSAPRDEAQQATVAITQIIQRLDLAGELVMTE